MKRRTVKVNLYHVPLNNDAPDYDISSETVRNYLNQIFLPKINVDFDVRPVVTLPGGWDADVDGAMDALPENAVHGEQQAILGSRPQNAPIANIDIFLMSGLQFKVDAGGTAPLDAWGVTNRAQRACWINAEVLPNPSVPGSGRTIGQVGLTLSHEIGHIFTDYGHPDEDDGVSPLKGTNRTIRLMHSGETTRGGRLGNVLVKEEWDAAETWLKNEEANQRL